MSSISGFLPGPSPMTTVSVGLAVPSGKSDARAAFDALASMSPAERMREMMLGQLGLSQAEFDALPADERKAIQEKIEKMIKDEVERAALNGEGQPAAGQIADITV